MRKLIYRETALIITSALPYANGEIHLGHIASTYLPADICKILNKIYVNILGSKVPSQNVKNNYRSRMSDMTIVINSYSA